MPETESSQEPPYDNRKGLNSRAVRLVHLAPAPILDRYGAGNWKDFKGRRIVFNALGIESPLIGFDVENPITAISSIGESPTDVFLEYSARPAFMRSLQQSFPDAQIHLRMHNAEALQHWHRSNPTWIPSKRNLRNLYGTLRLAWLDRNSAEIACSRFGISEWDNHHYWRWLSNKPLCYLPYFCPWPWLLPETTCKSFNDRPPRVICMPGGGDRLSQQQTALFDHVAGMIQSADRCPNREFLVSKGLIGANSMPLENAKRVDFQQPWEILTQSRAVAVLTDLGFGMKTTIIDGLAAGAHVLVHKGLIPRLPEEIARVVIPVDTNAPNAGKMLAETISKAPAGTANINTDLMNRAKARLANAMQLGSGLQHPRNRHDAS